MPLLAEAQWQNTVDRIFQCHSLRFLFGSMEWDATRYMAKVLFGKETENEPKFPYPPLLTENYLDKRYKQFQGGKDLKEDFVSLLMFQSYEGVYAVKVRDKNNDFVDYIPSGVGYMFACSGNGYEGSGLIIYTKPVYQNCKFFVGQFLGGKPMNGRFYSENGTLLFDGSVTDWSNPEIPEYNYPNPSKQFKYTRTGQDAYLGETSGGVKRGTGLYVWANGDAWFGEWSNGVRNGAGIMLYNNCTIKFGFWYGNQYYKNKQ